MAQVGLFNVGTSPLGSGVPDHPEGTGYPSTGAYTLPDGTGTPGSAGSDLSGPRFSGVRLRHVRDALTGAPFFLTYPITGGSITEDIDSLPYATGSYESVGLSQIAYNLLQQGSTGFVDTLLQITVQSRLGTADDYIESNVNLGRYYIEEVHRRAEPGSFGASFKLVGEAAGTLGPTVSGDLTGQALGTASGLGLVYGDRASIEGIAAWLLVQGGRRVRLSEGFLAVHPPTPAYQLEVDGNYIGPYSMGTRGAAQVLKQAMLESGIYLASDTDGTAVLTPYADGVNTPPVSIPVRSYGYGTYDHPFAFVGPAPIAKPSSVSVIQQSALVATRTVTVSISGGQDTGVVRYMNHFRPVATDPDDHQTRRTQQFAAKFVMSAEQIEIGILDDGAVHAGDPVLIDASSHGISPGLFMVVRANHPLGVGQYVGSLTCQRLAYTWT